MYLISMISGSIRSSTLLSTTYTYVNIIFIYKVMWKLLIHWENEIFDYRVSIQNNKVEERKMSEGDVEGIGNLKFRAIFQHCKYSWRVLTRQNSSMYVYMHVPANTQPVKKFCFEEVHFLWFDWKVTST